MEISYLLYVLIGKLIIYFGMKFPPLANSRNNFVKQLFSCDECLGGWVYVGMSLVMGEALFRDVFYVPILSEAGTGLLTAFLVHLITLGWKEKFSIIIIE